MVTYVPKVAEVEKKWHLIDARGKVLGKVAARAATLLRGKHKPVFTPHLDVGDYVVVINADKVVLTGRKESTKTYYWHTFYPGGLKSISFKKYRKEKPEELFREAVKGMLPHNRLGKKILRHLFVYRGEKHPHQSQNPQSYILKD